MLLSRRRKQFKENKVVEIKEELSNYEEMTKAEIKAILDTKGIEYNDRDNKSTLIKLLK